MNQITVSKISSFNILHLELATLPDRGEHTFNIQMPTHHSQKAHKPVIIKSNIS